MNDITLELDDVDFPIILERFGTEGAKRIAIQMCLRQGQEITETRLYSNLANLESDLESEMLL